jgi:hypothetical protein
MARLQELLLGLGCAALLAGMAEPAAANSYQLTFGASDFGSFPGGTTPPVGFVLGQFTFALDLAHDSNGSVATDFVNLAHGAMGYEYVASTGLLLIGGTLNGVSSVSGGTDDLSLVVEHFNSAPSYFAFSYASALGPGALFQAGNGDIHVDVTATPLPAALPLFASAVGGLGFVGWRRKQASAG